MTGQSFGFCQSDSCTVVYPGDLTPSSLHSGWQGALFICSVALLIYFCLAHFIYTLNELSVPILCSLTFVLLLLFSLYVMPNSLWSHGLQHPRCPCPSLSPAVCSNSCPLSRWCYLTVSSSSMSSFWLQSCPASGCFWMSQFSSGGQSIRASASTLVLQHQSFQWIFRLISFRIYWFDPLAVQGTLKSLLQHHNLKESILQGTAFFMAQLSHPYMTTGKP